ncbi:hypothetical protein IEN85_22345 [Pelagicoccus sp. NFK12]|uniref:Uncharacterized protein n=1 Tax=Pelagicoccus enzymogenes TaxID=2773457 RepID=A0A927FED9_9BACT|nr:hypothetical protein [Pelagicoccus enzymogenes]MBD5782256.1 hypothetical protein [Pelagicoccus enzymogenes]MDQ8197848.1 hypothetical protein [Pelagicoccus enzymogenes]
MKHFNAAFLRSLFAFFALALCAAAHGQDANKTEFGPYVALTRDANIVQDVKVEENGRIYLLLNPDFKEKEIILKNSSALKSGYRKWFNGEFELVSPANQGKAPGEYTDWVTTSGNYVEYYMEGKLILHLAKKSVANR